MPWPSASQDPPRPNHRRSTQRGPLHILVIEDDLIFQKIIESYLHKSPAIDARVIAAGSLRDGIAELEKRSIDAVLLDLTLPDSEGLATLEGLREGAARVPIIVLTGLDDDDVAAEAVRRGAQDFLFKNEFDHTGSFLVRAVLYAVERSRLEQQLFQSQKMETLGRLAGGLAHDFNNLLTVITACCDVLRLESELDNEKVHPQVLEIEKAADRAASLTRQLLAVSRRHVAQTVILDLNQVVTQTDEMLRRLIGERVEVVMHLATELPPIKADRAQLEQILVNLVVNARDAMPDGGRLTIETRDISPAAASQAHRAELVVSDTGHGMTRDILDKIFEPFFTTKSSGKGTGLGLSIVDSLVKQSGGDIHVTSRPRRGSTFQVLFPVSEKAPEESQAAERPVVTGTTGQRSGRVLLIEDEELLRQVVVALLEPQGFTVIPCANATEAIEALDRGTPFDVVLTDVVLPDRNGFQLAEEIRARFPSAPILFMSGYTDTEMGKNDWLEKGSRILQKPFTADQLLGSLDEVLNRPESRQTA